MDLPPVLAALGAKVSIVGLKGSRDVAVEALYTGYYETVLARDELIADVTVPSMAGRKAAYLKMTARSADDWPALGVAVAFNADGNRLRDVQLVVSAATATVMRLKEAEKILNGGNTDDATLKRAGDAAAAEAPIIGDLRGSVAYKRELLRIGVGRAVHQALSGKTTH